MSVSNRLLTAVLLRVDYGCACDAWNQTSEDERASFGIFPPSAELYAQMVNAMAALTPDEKLRVNAASSAEFDRLYVGPANRQALLRRASDLSAAAAFRDGTEAELFEQAVEADVQWRVLCSAWHNSTEAERSALALSPPTDTGYAPARRAAERLNRKDQARVSVDAFYRFRARYTNDRASILEAAAKRPAQRAASVAAPTASQSVQAAAVLKAPEDPWAATVAKLTAEASPDVRRPN